MKKEVQEYTQKYCADIQKLFFDLRNLVYQSIPCEIEEKLWAKIPSYYVGEKFIRIIPFKDHINIEAKAAVEYINDLVQYKLTPKGMLQIYLNQSIPNSILITIFHETLME
ncbi:MAG: DUF1801 domain-containing protein [Anaerocolumna sp.]